MGGPAGTTVPPKGAIIRGISPCHLRLGILKYSFPRIRFFDCTRAVSHGRLAKRLRAQSVLGGKGTTWEPPVRLSRNQLALTNKSSRREKKLTDSSAAQARRSRSSCACAAGSQVDFQLPQASVSAGHSITYGPRKAARLIEPGRRGFHAISSMLSCSSGESGWADCCSKPWSRNRPGKRPP